MLLVLFWEKGNSWGWGDGAGRRLKEENDEEKAYYLFLLRVFVLKTRYETGRPRDI